MNTKANANGNAAQAHYEYEDLLPDEILVTQNRKPGIAEELVNAPSRRIAAAEIIREGYLLHYGRSRWYDFDNADMALLAGDRMYSAGLIVLAADRDVEAVVAIAEVIGGCAEAHAIGEPAAADDLWTSTLAMLARGSASDGQA
jgi:hypothetical protein